MISIVIPTLNEEKNIGATLRNLEPLRRLGNEIIVCDGQSTDRTASIARQYADRVVVLPDIKRRTIARQRNLGAASARGEYIAFQDADVVIPDPAEFFAKALAAFESRPGLVAISARLLPNPSEARRADKIVYFCLNIIFAVMNNVLHKGAASGEFQMVRRSAFERIRGFNENMPAGEDNDLFSRLAALGQVRVERGLAVWVSPRRAHAIGWPRLVWKWMSNFLSVSIFHRSASKDWQPIR